MRLDTGMPWLPVILEWALQSTMAQHVIVLLPTNQIDFQTLGLFCRGSDMFNDIRFRPRLLTLAGVIPFVTSGLAIPCRPTSILASVTADYSVTEGGINFITFNFRTLCRLLFLPSSSLRLAWLIRPAGRTLFR